MANRHNDLPSLFTDIADALRLKGLSGDLLADDFDLFINQINVGSDSSSSEEYTPYVVVVTSDQNFAGNVLTITSDSGEIVTKSISSEYPYYSIVFLPSTGVWEFTINNNGDFFTKTLNVKTAGIFNLKFASYNFKGWLSTTDITESYTSIDDVPELVIRKLMTLHSSVDYLVEWISRDLESANTILNNHNCIKWINLRDYALDTLMDNDSIKTIMDDIGLYGYGEVGWVGDSFEPLGLVPKMTSNSAPYGTASASSTFSDSGNPLPWKAFNGTNNGEMDGWIGSSGNKTGWLQYKFVKPVSVRKVYFENRNFGETTNQNCRIKAYKIQASNNGSNWIDLTSVITRPDSANAQGSSEILKFKNDDYYTYYRLTITDSFTNITGCAKLQFYGRETVDYSEREFEEDSTKNYLYDHGLELVTIDSTGNAIKNSNSFNAKVVTASTFNGLFTESLDLTNYKTIKVKASDTAVEKDSICYYIIINDKTPIKWDVNTWVSRAYFTASTTSASLDISKITSNHSIYLGTGGTVGREIEIKECWLE